MEREAAINLRRIWQAHDERDEIEGWDAASNLFEILGVSKEDSSKAGFMIIHAYFLYDQSRMYMGRNEEMENFFDTRIGYLLRESRRITGLETESVKHTVSWWRASRHNDIESIKSGIYQEHLEQFKNLDVESKEKFAAICTKALVKAGEAHNLKNWKMVDDRLENYYKIYFEALGFNHSN